MSEVVTGDAVVLDVQIAQLPVRAVGALIDIAVIFIGYVLGGWRGAGVATAGIFLPAFVFVAASGPLVPRLRRSRVAGGFLDGVNAGSLALMAAVTLQLARPVLVDPVSIAIAVVAAVLLIRFRVSSAWLLPAAALFGLLWRG